MWRLSLISSLLFCFNAAAQNLDQTLRGYVLDKVTSQPLIGANIILTDSNLFKGTVTDINGSFILNNVPVGRRNISVSYLGYEDRFIPNILVTTGKEIVLNIKMEESLKELETVTVTAPEKYRPINNMALVSAQSFSIEQSERYAGSVNDPARLAQSFAGVAQNSDFGNEIIVRGNSPKGLLWQVEGIPMPNPNHYGEEGGGGGVISILSNNVLDHSDFFTGAFPAEYGNAVAGVFDLNLRPGNEKKREYTLELGMIGMDAAIEGPFSLKKKSSYLVNYRYSTLGILDELGYDMEGRTVTSFQDLNIKLNFPLKNKGTLGVFAIGGSSTTSFDKDLTARNPGSISVTARERYFYDVGLFGITYEQSLNKKTRINSSIGLGGYRLSYGTDILDAAGAVILEDKFQSGDYSLRYHFQLNHKLSPKHYLRTGIRLSQLNFLSYQAEKDSVWERKYEAEGQAGYYEYYAQWKFRASDRFTITPGLHSAYFSLNKQVVLEPRLALKYKLRSGTDIRSGVGIHSLTESLVTYLGDKTKSELEKPNMDLKLMRAAHFVLGLDQRIFSDWQLSMEAYYQYLYDIPIKADTNSPWTILNKNSGFVLNELFNNGQAYNYGIELTARKSFSKQWYLLANASLFESKYRNLDNVLRNTKYNNNFIYNLTAGKDFKTGKKRTNLIGSNCKVLWIGGRRGTPIDMERSIAKGKTIYVASESNTIQMPHYFRFDIRFSYRKNNPDWSWIISLDIQNITNRYNIYREIFNPISYEIEYIEQIGIVPAFKFRIEL